jgi:DNA-binding CsgD family transcriptional regulator
MVQLDPRMSSVIPTVAAATLDVVPNGIAFYDTRGAILHCNRAFRTAAKEAPLAEEAAGLAMEAWGEVNVRRLSTPEQIADRTVEIGHGSWRLEATWVPRRPWDDGAAVLISLAGWTVDPLSESQLRERFGLTPKQSSVARLLAKGCRNDEIARRLFISPHTARHHVEQIVVKTGGGSRTAVARRLLDA